MGIKLNGWLNPEGEFIQVENSKHMLFAVKEHDRLKLHGENREWDDKSCKFLEFEDSLRAKGYIKLIHYTYASHIFFSNSFTDEYSVLATLEQLQFLNAHAPNMSKTQYRDYDRYMTRYVD